MSDLTDKDMTREMSIMFLMETNMVRLICEEVNLNPRHFRARRPVHV